MPAPASSPVLDGGLRRWVQDATTVAVTRAAPLGSGASRRTWAVELADGTRVVLREDTGDGPVTGTPLTLAREAAVYRALAETSIPVPALLAAHPHGQALLLSLATGTENLRDGTPDELAAVARDYLGWLARLHELDPAALSLGPLSVPAGTTPTRHDIDLWRGILDTRTGDRGSLAAATALTWLADNEPDATGFALCHGDAGPGNFLRDGSSVTALLDWEFAHVDDPHDDLAWVAVRNQLLGRPFDLASAYASWHRRIGRRIDRQALEYHRSLVLARMLVSCDATLAWTSGGAGARVQAVLQPWLAVALVEALGRCGCDDGALVEAERDARARFDASPPSHALGDPTRLDDFGAFL